MPYLQRIGPSHFDITLGSLAETADGSRTLLTRTNHKHLYWDIRQQLVTTPPMAARASRRHPRERHHQRAGALEAGAACSSSRGTAVGTP